jgi:hypothetical protein
MNYKKFKQVGWNALQTVCAVGLIGAGISSLAVLNSDETVTNNLKHEGYSDIKLGNYSWACLEHETGSRNFVALNPHHEPVEGHICTNIFGNRVSEEPVRKPKLK